LEGGGRGGPALSRLLLDASTVTAWLTPGQRTAASEALLDEAHEHDFAAPHLFPAEVRNVMLVQERNGRMDPSDTARALASLAAYRIAIAPPPVLSENDGILDLARREGLTFYDALYLHLALVEDLEVASRDGDLLAAALRNGLSIRDIR
jgi:predicted nucleic acid-binding protein